MKYDAELRAQELAADMKAGQAAKQLLETPVMRQAIQELESRYKTEWLKGKTVEEREAAWQRTIALADLLGELGAIIQNGETAEVIVDRAERKGSQ